MFYFSKTQQIIDINGVQLGGQPGQLPTVMVGSIFYHSDTTVSDPVNGEFDKNKVMNRLTDNEEQGLKTGNLGCMMLTDLMVEL